MKNPVLYWMQAAQRTEWNPALSHAAQRASEEGRPLEVVFVLTERIPEATLRPYVFMLEGLGHTFSELEKRGIGARALIAVSDLGNPGAIVARWAQEIRAARVVADTGELRFQREWRDTLSAECSHRQIELELVDSCYIVPPAIASDHQEWSAASIRRKIIGRIGVWLDEARASQKRWLQYPPFVPLSFDFATSARSLGFRLFDPRNHGSGASVLDLLPSLDTRVGALEGPVYVEGGHKAALAAVDTFIANGLRNYNERRSDKRLASQSNLSPWLHFGMISPAEILDIVLAHLDDEEMVPDSQGLLFGEFARSPQPQSAFRSPSGSAADTQSIIAGLETIHPGAAAFVEQLVVRRELAANLCRYNPAYDRWEGLPVWARSSLSKHAADVRPWIYTAEQLEAGNGHDPYWNAAQQQLRTSGTIHNYMRMYWGKKILEWSKTPEEAFYTAVRLNDRWALDGRDANGYTGVAWCFGTHDRPWTERPIFGMVRYMNDKGLERKFDMKPYVARWL